MKTKKLAKRLVLNKKTVANLNNRQLVQVLGGATTPATCPDTCSITNDCCQHYETQPPDVTCVTCGTCQTVCTCNKLCPPILVETDPLCSDIC